MSTDNLNLRIVNDFRELCSFIETENPPLSSKKEVLGKKDAFSINSRLYYKREVDKPHYQQEHYPALNLLFTLAIEGQLFKKVKNEKGNISLHGTNKLESFRQLNDCEQYCFLLETYWCCYDFASQFDSMIWSADLYPLQELFNAFLQVGPGNSITSKYDHTNSSLCCLFSLDHPVILQLATFDLCSYELNEEASSPYDDRLKSIAPTLFGIEICSLLLRQGFRYQPQELFPLPYRALAAKLDMYKPKKGLHKVLAKAFPAGAVTQTIEDESLIKQPGTYYFKIALKKKLWRIIKLAHPHSLYDLHLAIEDAFEFDEEHLYAFYLDIGELKRRRGRYGIYCSEFEDEVFNVEDAVIGTCGFYPGQSMTYLFDFGDQIIFDITLLKIDTTEPLPHSPVMVDQKGELPEPAPD